MSEGTRKVYIVGRDAQFSLNSLTGENPDHDLEKHKKNIPKFIRWKTGNDLVKSLGHQLIWNSVSQVFICWAQDQSDQFAETLNVCHFLHTSHPCIKIYVRVFDEELIAPFEKLGAVTFSTSFYAIEMLKKDVLRDSNIL